MGALQIMCLILRACGRAPVPFTVPHRTLTRHVDPMLSWCSASVADAGPTSTQHWVNVSCLLGGRLLRQGRGVCIPLHNVICPPLHSVTSAGPGHYKLSYHIVVLWVTSGLTKRIPRTTRSPYKNTRPLQQSACMLHHTFTDSTVYFTVISITIIPHCTHI